MRNSIIKIKHVEILNFCGIEKISQPLSDVIEISGDNETGKSTFASAITWVLTGTDIDGNTLQDVLPRFSENVVSPKVTLELEITNEEKVKPATVSKTYKAKINRQKEFTGEYDTVYAINGVDVTLKKYTEWILENICSPEIFNLLLNVKTFTEKIKTTGKELTWQKQRRIIEQVVLKDVSDAELIKKDEKYSVLTDGVARHDLVSEYIKQVKTEYSQIEKQAVSLQGGIQAIEEIEPDTDVDIAELTAKEEKVKLYLDDLTQKNEQYRRATSAKVIEEIETKRTELQIMETKYNEALNHHNANINKIGYEKQTIENHIALKTAELNKFRKDYARVKDEPIKETCPTCNQPLQDIEQNKKIKMDNLLEIQKKGKEIAEFLADLQKQLDDKAKELAKFIAPEKDITYSDISLQIERLKEKVSEVEDLPEYTENFPKYSSALIKLTSKRLKFESNQGIKEKSLQMQKDHAALIEKQMELKQLIDICSDFISNKCTFIEEEANKYFKDSGIEFKLFKQNKTNDEIKEIFEIQYKGKDYNSQLSLSTKLLVSYKITVMLQIAFGVRLPIILDNMESVNFNEDIDTQMFFFERIQDNCPKCEGNGGRRNQNNHWICEKCGHEWQKELKIENM